MNALKTMNQTDCCPSTRDSSRAREIWPATDILETPTAIRLDLDVPGIAEQEVDVQVTDGVLSVRASNDTRRYSRSFVLPDGLDLEAIDATLRHGVLRVTLPKVEALKPRKISVKTSG